MKKKNKKKIKIIFLSIIVLAAILFLAYVIYTKTNAIPNITNLKTVCDTTHLSLCLDEATCTAATGYWYNSVCNTNPQCTEDWICTAWSLCAMGTKIRSCSDINVCGTDINKPSLSISCS